MPSFNYVLRPALPADEPFLWEMLYQAIYVPSGAVPPPRALIYAPELACYVRDWGQPDDVGLLAVTTLQMQPLGAAWLRLLNGENRGYGYVDDTTPELSLAVLPAYRGMGIGTRLITCLLESVQARYRAVSLSVSAENPALNLYQRLGFVEVGSSGASITMKKVLLPA